MEGENVLDLEAARRRLVEQDEEDKEVSMTNSNFLLMIICHIAPLDA